MADDEQFSLCWNNFNSNLSAGFHESLCRGDLVDVTLAAEGQFVKAHRLVLSVCSPYFRRMFTQMPSNQHAFVFLKDVSHTALKDLIQFMYCGEVNVKQEALPAFISTAEALQIKGLTDSDPPPPQPTEPTVPAPPITQIHNVNNTPPRTRNRTTTRTYKLETVDADEDEPLHQTQTKAPQTTQIVIQTAAPTATIGAQQQQLHTVVQGATVQQISTVAVPTSSAGNVSTATQKRTLRTSSGPNVKRTKNSSTTTTSSSLADPLDTANEPVSSQSQQITVQASIVTTATPSDKNQSTAAETEYIDLPIEIPTKSEPDYTEETGEAEGGDPDGTYGEDDSYGEMRYDDNYFTENEDAGNATTGGGTSTSATTSKTVTNKQQSSFSDSSFTAAADAGEQTNNDAQGWLTFSYY